MGLAIFFLFRQFTSPTDPLYYYYYYGGGFIGFVFELCSIPGHLRPWGVLLLYVKKILWETEKNERKKREIL